MGKGSLKLVFKGKLHISNTGTMLKSGSVFGWGGGIRCGICMCLSMHTCGHHLSQTP